MLSCANKSLVYAPISRLRRSFAGIRKMPTSRAIKKETCKQACSLFFYRLDWHFIHCFRVYYSITVATRPDPTVHPPSRYFNIILPHIFYGFLSKIQWKTTDLYYLFLFAWFLGTVLAPEASVKKLLFCCLYSSLSALIYSQKAASFSYK